MLSAEGATYQEYNLENKIDGKDHSNSNRTRYELLFYRVHSLKPYMKIPCDAIMDVPNDATGYRYTVLWSC